MIKSLCVLGGGTSGLIAALMMRRAYPNMKISIIESSKIGIIGVGEGSTEHWKQFMDYIDIDVPTIVRECGATFKIGIKFTNWNGDGKAYWHSLTEQFSTIHTENNAPLTWMKMIAENWDPEETCWDLSRKSWHVEPYHDILSQYHFDTFKLNEFFHKLCSERNIEIIDTEIQDVVLDNEGYVSYLKDNDRQYVYDFYIDCSGFGRVIATKLGVKWIDKKDQLPMNSAIAFPTGYKEEIPSYTEATALSSGWVWRIPTQERFGNGYVFCDDFINEDKAYEEVSMHYKNNLGIDDELKIGRKVKFGAGYVDKFWSKNCLSLGLNGMFVEPLEASSIGSTIQEMRLFIPTILYWSKGEQRTEKIFNDRMSVIAENIVDFIQLHYITKRNDTEFWRWVNNNIKYTDFINENLDYFKNNYPNAQIFNETLQMFSYLNWMQVMHGLGLFNYDKCNQYWKETFAAEHDDPLLRHITINTTVKPEHGAKPHREVLEILKTRYGETKYEF